MRVSGSAAAAALAIGLLSGPAAASVPPGDWKPATWTGPAKVCAEGFVLQIRAGETVTQGWPSVGVIRYTVQSEGRQVILSELWAASDPRDPGRRVEARPGGYLYQMTRLQAETANSYAYLPQGYPKTTRPLPVAAIFSEPRGPGAPAWSRKDERAVLDRITFAPTETEWRDCTPPDGKKPS